MKYLVPAALGLVVLLAGPKAPSAQAQKKEALVDQVKKSIDKGVKFLRGAQRDNGSWEVNAAAAMQKGGWTSLALLALLNSGVPAEDRDVARGLDYLRGLQPGSTYVRALQTMVFVDAGQKKDVERIGDNIKWLIEARVIKNGELRGWSYTKNAAFVTDNSNTQYAMLGLHAGKKAGVKINEEIWKSIRDYYIRTQDADGSFTYNPFGREGGSSLTMTTAGLCGLLIAGMELNSGREILMADGTASNCGNYKENLPVHKALDWISGPRRDRLVFNLQQRTFYNLYGIERAGRLSGQRFLGRHDWYREGCVYLVREQHDDGSWHSLGAWDNWPVVSTSFALLFLSKGRTPVLISKMVHTPNGERGRDDLDWNNDRNDIRHLTDFASNKLFNDIPLAWQIFDMVRAAGPAPNEDDLAEVTSDLLQSPILYITGHKNPRLRMSGTEKKLLKKYVDNGGFILAEACCGSKKFNDGFQELVKELWPDNKLDYLSGQHPIWKASGMLVKPGQPYKLMGLEMGCKTVLVYSPQDLSCRWESNNLDKGEVLQAFRLGANIIAYATGMEPPRPRLTEIKIAREGPDRVRNTGGYFEVVQLKHNGDFKPAPRAMSNLMDSMRRLARLDVILKTTEKSPGQDIKDYKFLYMHGRKEFSYSEEELGYLRFNLENGGLLLADACCGQEAFDKAFRKFAQELFPKHKLQRIPIDDLLFSKKLNPEALTEKNIQCRQERNAQPRSMAPWLEGIKIDGRWAIIYSKYDIGCALERHQSLDCRGYTPESALRIAQAAVLYTLWPE